MRVNIPGKQKEYYLIENRQSRGYDVGLKKDYRYTGYNTDGGIIVWHTDESVMDAYTYDVENGAQTKYTYLQDLAINDTYHHPAITPVYLEYDNSVQEKSYNFRDNTADFHTGLFTADWLSKYGLSKIDLMSYTGSDVNLYSYPTTDIVNNYSDRVSDRAYTGISIEVPQNSDNMEITITNNNADPRTQPNASYVCPPGIPDENGVRHVPVLVVVAGYNNISYDPSYNWSKAIFGEKDSEGNYIQGSLNDKGVYENGDNLREYLRVMSHGKFVIDPVEESYEFPRENNPYADNDVCNDGVIHITLNKNHWESDPEKNGNYQGDEDKDISEAIDTAIDSKSNYIDIAKYDLDDSGIIENDEMMTVVLFAGHDSASKSKSVDVNLSLMSGAWCDDFKIGDKLMNKYEYTIDNNGNPEKKYKLIPWHITSAEKKLKKLVTLADGSTRVEDVMTSYGSIAHEALHFLGIPDYYPMTNAKGRTDEDTYEWQNYKVQCLSPLGRPHGIYVHSDGTPDGYSTAPYSLDPWAKIRLGWAEAKAIEYDGDISKITETVNAYDYGNIDTQTETILRINNPKNPNEYYLIENRQFIGYDIGMKYDPNFIDSFSNGGIVAWHIDESVLNATTYGSGNKETYLQHMAVNDTYHRPAIMPAFVENNNTSGSDSYTFLGHSVNYRAAIHSSESLDNYGLNKIDLTYYTGSNLNLYAENKSIPSICPGDKEKEEAYVNYSDRVCDREYADISVTPSESSGNMSVDIKFNDNDHPERMSAVYIEMSDDLFPNTPKGETETRTPYLYAYKTDNNIKTPYASWPGVKMDHVRDNIYVAYVPTDYRLFKFNEGEAAGENNYTEYDLNNLITTYQYRNKDLRNTYLNYPSVIYSNGKWQNYLKAQYPDDNNGKLIRGDVDMDPTNNNTTENAAVQEINIGDATMLQLYLCRYCKLSQIQLVLADADYDGHVNINDVTAIQMLLAENAKGRFCGKAASKILI